MLLSSFTHLPVRLSTLEAKKISRIISRVFLWTLIGDLIIVPAVFIKIFYNPWRTPFVFVSAATRREVKFGQATESFINQLKLQGQTPIAVKTIHKPAFTVDGQLFTLGGDNIQVFEYSDHETAVKDASALALTLAQQSSISSRSLAWKKQIHLYVDGTLAIFYMGNSEWIVSSLEQNAGLSQMEMPQIGEQVASKVGN